MNYYPHQLAQILAILDALNRLDKELTDLAGGDDTIMLSNPVSIIDTDGNEFGVAVDIVGGAWSWCPDKEDYENL